MAPTRVRVDLMKGWPSYELLPPSLLRRAAMNTLSQTDESVLTEILEYADDEGYKPLRKAVAEWLTQFYRPKDAISLDRICITGGASQNLANVLASFTDPIYTLHIYLVAPTYYLACRIFADAGFDDRLRAVPEDEEGIDLAFLEQRLQESEDRAVAEGNLVPRLKQPKPWRKIYRHVVYCVPTFANPSGRIMSRRRREDLVKLARKYDALVVSDDVYDMLQWPATGPTQTMDTAYLPRLVDIDRTLDGGPVGDFGHTLSNGSFSKIISPGCRTGWAEGTPRLAYGLSQNGGSRSGGAPSHLVASFIHDMLEKGTLQQHIFHFLQPEYAERYHRILAAVEQHLSPLGLTMPQANKEVAGGYFVWLKLPGRLVANVIYQKALEADLIIHTGPKFRVDGDETPEARFNQNIRLCFAWEEKDLLEEGVARLASVIRACQAEV
jgi:DNA-binding transcriptional MocR family regulator